MKTAIAVIEAIGLLCLGVALGVCLHILQLGWWTMLIGMLFALSGICLLGAEGLRNAIKSD